jgi:hypothetical protein
VISTRQLSISKFCPIMKFKKKEKKEEEWKWSELWDFKLPDFEK